MAIVAGPDPTASVYNLISVPYSNDLAHERCTNLVAMSNASIGRTASGDSAWSA